MLTIGNSCLHFQIGSSCAHLGEPVRAAESYRKAIECGFTKSCVYDMLAKAIFTAGDAQGAKLAWEMAVAANPRDHEAHVF